MNNKRGFTIIEILVVITILLVTSIGGTFAFTKVMSNNKLREWKNIQKNITDATETYINTDKEVHEHVYESCLNVKIPLKTLSDRGLIKDNLKNPITGEKLNYSETVLAESSPNCAGLILYSYKDYISGDPKFVCEVNPSSGKIDKAEVEKIIEDYLKNHSIGGSSGPTSSYIAKGTNVRNWVKFGTSSNPNLLWRILWKDEMGSMRIVTESSIGTYNFPNSGDGSFGTTIDNNINAFYNSLTKKENVIESSYCSLYTRNDESGEFANKCSSTYNKKVGTLSILDIEASFNGGTSYITSGGSTAIFGSALYTRLGSPGAWINYGVYYPGNGMSPNYHRDYINLPFRPVVTLNEKVKIVSGIGSKEDPFVIG
ncbi:MAG: prepilin-type N-terminal cleavage/methylation domain-containing protein [Bacilli bacterium]